MFKFLKESNSKFGWILVNFNRKIACEKNYFQSLNFQVYLMIRFLSSKSSNYPTTFPS